MSQLSRIQKISIAAVMAIAVAVPVASHNPLMQDARGGGHWGDHGRTGRFAGWVSEISISPTHRRLR
jgi:hypothetical protein